LAILRAVFDTNVVVSALVFGRRLAWLRQAWAGGVLVPVVCRNTTDELLRVLHYPKFRLSTAECHFLLEDYLPYAEVAPPLDNALVLPVYVRDHDDAVFLRLALAVQVPLVSGDRDVAVLREIAPVPIWSATDLQRLLSK
jgi:uncharacterized protein